MSTEYMKIARTAATLFAASIALGACQNAEDKQSSLEAANLEKAIYCMELLEKHLDIERADRECFGETYVQHTPWVADGREAVIAAFTNRVQKNPALNIDIKRTAANGDLVWIHGHVKATPDALGSAVVNIFRMEDGKFVEHWNVVTPVPEESLNDNTMF